MTRRQQVKLLIIIACGIALLVALYLLGSVLERRGNPEPTVHPADSSRSLIDRREVFEVNGTQYALRRGLTSFLIAGIDRDVNPLPSSTISRASGQADFLIVVVADHLQKRVYQITIDRDTLTEIPVLSAMGEPKGTRKAQIALSHAYGSNATQAAELLMSAVEHLLSDTDIQFYVTFTMDAINAMNQAVGGVTVYIEEDMTNVDPAFVKGQEITLQGNQAELFVRARKNVGDGSNIARIGRQSVFITAFLGNISNILTSNINQIDSVMEALSPYLTSNLKTGRMLNEIHRMNGYAFQDSLLIQGSRVVNETNHVEFVVDRDSLMEILLEVFYEKI